MADDQRSGPEDLSKLYIKSDDGQRMIPLSAVTSWHPVIGPQAVNHINQFTSVTMFFNLKPGYCHRACHAVCGADGEGASASGCSGATAGRSADVPEHSFRSRDADAGGRLRHVRDSGDPLRELPAPDHGAVVACPSRCWADCLRCGCSARKLRCTPTSACSC